MPRPCARHALPRWRGRLPARRWGPALARPSRQRGNLLAPRGEALCCPFHCACHRYTNEEEEFFPFSLEHVGPRCRRDDGKSGAVNTLSDPRSTVELLRGGAMRICSSGAVFQSWSSAKHTSTSMRDSHNSRSNIMAYKRTKREGSRQASYYIIPRSNNLDPAVQC
jgi:hypothetical protein